MVSWQIEILEERRGYFYFAALGLFHSLFWSRSLEVDAWRRSDLPEFQQVGDAFHELVHVESGLALGTEMHWRLKTVVGQAGSGTTWVGPVEY